MRPRGWPVVVGAMVLLGACGPTAPSAEVSPPPRPPVPATAASAGVDEIALLATAVAPPAPPRTVLIVGDSGMVDLSPALEAMLTAAGTRRVVNAAGPGFGLTREQFTWRSAWRAAIDAEDPDLVLVMLGGWDLPYVETAGTGAYSELVAEALQVLMSRGARVEWLAMPSGGRSYLPKVNQVLIGLPRWSTSIDFFDAGSSLQSPDGTYVRTVPSIRGPLLVRKPDHWHFCPSGAELVAAAVGRRLAELRWSLPPQTGWEQGAWRQRADLYDEPHGACDPA